MWDNGSWMDWLDGPWHHFLKCGRRRRNGTEWARSNRTTAESLILRGLCTSGGGVGYSSLELSWEPSPLQWFVHPGWMRSLGGAGGQGVWREGPRKGGPQAGGWVWSSHCDNRNLCHLTGTRADLTVLSPKALGSSLQYETVPHFSGCSPTIHIPLKMPEWISHFYNKRNQLLKIASFDAY